jgi:predicted HTH transcriptional regulator
MDLIKIPTDLSNLKKFPYSESKHIEYKLGIKTFTTEKIYELVCSFLNSGGGYIIVGVEDTTHNIVGISNEKEIDNIILICDQIITNNIIVLQDNTCGLHKNNIIISTIDVNNTKKIIIIKIIPDKNKEYMLKEGTIWMRLNASNYKLRGCKLYTEADVSSKINTTIQNINREYKKNIKKLEKQFEEINSKYIQLQSENASNKNTIIQLKNNIKNKDEYKEKLMNDNKYISNLLFEKIIMDKNIKENQIKLSNFPWFSFFCSY